MAFLASSLFEDFVYERYNAMKEDAPIAAALLSNTFPGTTRVASIPDEYHKKEIFLDARMESDTPHISYTTVAAYLKRFPGSRYISLIGALQTGPHRTHARAGRVAQRITGITDGRALDVFVSELGAYLSPKNQGIEIVEGSDISYWYAERNYCGCGHHDSLSNSCMRYDELPGRGTFKFYEDYAQMIISRHLDCRNGEWRNLNGRAILWTDYKGDRWVDRVYGSPRIVARIMNWCRDNNISQVYGSGTPIGVPMLSSGKYVYDSLPYFDTMGSVCRTCNMALNIYGSCPRQNDHETIIREGRPLWTRPERKTRVPKDIACRCYSCDGELNDDGQCSNWVHCECCNHSWCSHAEDIPCDCNTCDECGERYDGYNCPNEQWCHRCDTSYHGDECPNEDYCEHCNTNYCGDECPYYSYCEKCAASGCDFDLLRCDCEKCPSCDKPATSEEWKENNGACQYRWCDYVWYKYESVEESDDGEPDGGEPTPAH